MNTLPVFAHLLGDSRAANFSALREGAEGWFVANAEGLLNWVVANAEGLLFFSGQHPDLEWGDFEQDSVWELVEYWLDVAAAAGPGARGAQALARAVGDAYVALLMLCPVQLSWVDNPTQLAADEQQLYSQYS